MNADVDNYIASAPANRGESLNMLHTLITRLYPEAAVDMRYKMPTYTVGDGWVALANQKHYISLYTCGYHHIEAFKHKHPDIKTGKGCINFKDKDNLPIENIEQVIRHAIEQPKTV